MPIYEFYSPDTNRIYSFYARSLAEGRLTPRCPDHPKARMERAISRFAITGNAQEKLDPVEGGAPDLRMEQAMAEMEREFSTMNEENPDPRQLGRMMRKMADATGQPMPEQMQEMVQRLEKGEDVEKLEEEMASTMEATEEEMNNPQPKEESQRSRGKISLPPRRDPTLYEMRDYL